MRNRQASYREILVGGEASGVRVGLVPRVAQNELSLNCSICSDNEARFYGALKYGLSYVIGVRSFHIFCSVKFLDLMTVHCNLGTK